MADKDVLSVVYEAMNRNRGLENECLRVQVHARAVHPRLNAVASVGRTAFICLRKSELMFAL